MSPTLVTQSRMASLMASFRVRLPLVTPTTLRAQQAHAEDVEPLPAHVFLAHVDHAFEAQQRADRGGGHAVLARAGFGDDAALAHAPRQQRLPQAVVDLVRAGVQQVFALEPDARAAQFLAEPLGEIERRGTAGIVVQQVAPVPPETRDRRAPPDTPSPIPRWAPSALPARSGRRRVRNVRPASGCGVMRARPPCALAKTRSFSCDPFCRARFRCASRHPRPRAAPARWPRRRWRRPGRRPARSSAPRARTRRQSKLLPAPP